MGNAVAAQAVIRTRIDVENEVALTSLFELRCQKTRRLSGHTLVFLANADNDGNIQLEKVGKGFNVHDI